MARKRKSKFVKYVAQDEDLTIRIQRKKKSKSRLQRATESLRDALQKVFPKRKVVLK